MSNPSINETVSSQAWQWIEKTNATLAQTAIEQKRGEAAAITELQEFDKDVVLPKTRAVSPNRLVKGKAEDVVLSATPQGNSGGIAGAKAPVGKPPLTPPGFNVKLFAGDDDGQQTGLIAIMGAVLALQAKTNSSFWSNLWKQASQSMQMQVQFAPIVGSAICAQYNAQSAATSAQAGQSLTDGIISFTAFAGSLVMAFMMPETPGTENPAPSDEAAGTEDETTSEGSNASGAPDSPVAEETQTDQDADNTINDENNANKSRFQKTWEWAKPKLSNGFGRFQTYFGKVIQTSQVAQLMGHASQGIADSQYQNEQARYQGIEGQAAATSQTGQMYAQFYSQDFQRMEDLRQGSSQNLDYAMNILQQAANSLTQTVTSMFRG